MWSVKSVVMRGLDRVMGAVARLGLLAAWGALGLILAGAWVSNAAADQTNISWAQVTDGNWWTASNWMPQIVPNEANHDALLAGTSLYSVHIATVAGVSQVTIDNPQATLSLDSGGGFSNWSGALNNNGTIQVAGDSYSVKQLHNTLGSLFLVNPGVRFGQYTTINNDGTIRIESDLTHNPATITLPGNWGAGLTGTGRLILSAGGDPSRARLMCEGGYSAYWAQDVNHSLTGEGSIVGPFRNNGRVSADVDGRVLLLTDYYSGKTNSGVMEAVDGGILENGGTLTQEGAGVIRADGGTVRLLNGSWLLGGTLATANGSVIECEPGSISFSYPTNTGELDVLGGSTMVEWGNTLTNDGTIILNPHQVSDDAVFSGQEYTTIAGTGQLILRTAGDPNDARIQTQNSRMTNGPGHTIRGEGRIATGMTNQGRISADVPGRVLQLDSGDKTNTGILEAVGGGILDVYTNWIIQNGGGVTRADSGTVRLNSGVVVVGGTLATANGSAIEIVSGSVNFSHPTVSGEIDILGGSTVVADGGGFVNNGTILTNPRQVGADAVLQSTNGSTFEGTGQIVLKTAGDINDARIETPQYWRPTANGAGHTIRGEGLISAIMTNGGVIDADAPGKTLLLTNLGENTGTVRASGGNLEMQTPITNNGLAEARSGGTARFTDIGTNFGGGSLYRGAWHVFAGSTMRLLGADISLLNADVLLDGPQSDLYRGDDSTSALASLAQIGTGGRLEVRNGRVLAVAGSLQNNGIVTVGPQGEISVPAAYTQEGDSTHGVTTVRGALTCDSLVQINGGVLEGDGHVGADLINAGEVRPGFPVGSLTVDRGYQQTGTGALTLEIAGAAAGQHDQLLVTGGAQLAGKLVIRPVDGYAAVEGDSFIVMTYADHTGAFDELIADLGPGLEMVPIYNATNLTLRVTGPNSGIDTGSGGNHGGAGGPGPGSGAPGVPAELALSAYATGSGQAIFNLSLPEAAGVRISLFDLNGRLVAVPADEALSAGSRSVRWELRDKGGRPLPAGLYFVRADVTPGFGGGQTLRTRLLVLR
jgi:fibronectin-binding autotransporter adhesin